MGAKTRERRLWWRHLISVLVAPVTMAIVIPASIVNWPNVHRPDLGSPLLAGLVIIGGLLIVLGLCLMTWTVLLFDREGEGTLGVGNVMGEPVNLVVQGPYRHVRNPMITGLLSILLGEAAVLASGRLLVWFAVFCACIAGVIRFWEEPHLAQRYGSAYLDYRANVPRWIPRIAAWRPTSRG
jgi:protein-S-isoprenylcysteine O-methyltransferase Ste14